LSGSISELDRRLSGSISELDKRLGTSISEMDKRVTHSISEVDKRLYGIEAILHMKECCVLQQDQNVKKAE
jgi:hypothetical protein